VDTQPARVSFKDFCDVVKLLGNHTENNLAKFGSILDMKVGIYIDFILFLGLPTTTRTYH
jgi:hypothetical protein